MFSITNISKKVNESKIKYSFFKFLFGDISSLIEVLLLILATIFLSIPGAIFGQIFILPILKEYTGLILSVYMSISSIFFWYLIYRVDKKDNKKLKYNLSQEEMKEYLNSIDSLNLKEQAINFIADSAEKNKGNISFKEFENIYKKIEKLKIIEVSKREEESVKEATQCLIKSLKEEIFTKKIEEKV